MKYRSIAVWFAISVFAAFWTSCGSGNDGHGHEVHQSEHEHEHEHEHEIVLSPESAMRFGVKVDTVRKSAFSEVIKVTGSFSLTPSNIYNAVAKSSGIIKFASGVVPGMKVAMGQTIASVSAEGVAGGDPNAVSAAELDAAKRELERIRPLYDAGVVSLKELNAAKAAYDRAASASSGSSNGSVVSAMRAGVITQLLVVQGAFVEQGEPIARISSGDALILRADLPQKYASVAPRLHSANVRPASVDSIFSIEKFSGHRIDAPAVSSPVMPGYVPVYFSLNGDGCILPDSYAEVYLKGAGREDVVFVPQKAVTEEQGRYFVFVRMDEHGYEKRNVTLGQSDGINVEILSGLSEGDQVVTEGAIFVKLAQTSNVVPSGHSHNH